MIYPSLFREVKLIRGNDKHNSLSMKPSIVWVVGWAAIAVLVCSSSGDVLGCARGLLGTSPHSSAFNAGRNFTLGLCCYCFAPTRQKSITFQILIPVHCCQVIARRGKPTSSVLLLSSNIHIEALMIAVVLKNWINWAVLASREPHIRFYWASRATWKATPILKSVDLKPSILRQKSASMDEGTV